MDNAIYQFINKDECDIIEVDATVFQASIADGARYIAIAGLVDLRESTKNFRAEAPVAKLEARRSRRRLLRPPGQPGPRTSA